MIPGCVPEERYTSSNGIFEKQMKKKSVSNNGAVATLQMIFMHKCPLVASFAARIH